METEIRSLADIGALVRERRETFGWTQQQLADALGLTQRYCSELERGLPKLLDDRLLGALRKMGIALIAETPDLDGDHG